MNCIIILLSLFNIWILIETMSLKSQKTVLVTVVEHCPANQNEWKIASDKKKCQEISDIFDEDSLVYHCVPSYITKKFYELCAGIRLIAFGLCVEYNIFTKKVQENNEKRCSNFIDQSCPMHYPSNELYKYKGCYEFEKNMQADNDHIMTTRKDWIENKTQETTWGYEEKRLVRNEVKVTIFVATVLSMVLILASAIIFLRKKCAKRGYKNTCSEETIKLLKKEGSLNESCGEGSSFLNTEESFPSDQEEEIQNSFNHTASHYKLQLIRRRDVDISKTKIVIERPKILSLLPKQPSQYTIQMKLLTLLLEGKIKMGEPTAQQDAHNILWPRVIIDFRHLNEKECSAFFYEFMKLVTIIEISGCVPLRFKQIIRSRLLSATSKKGVLSQRIIFYSFQAFLYCLDHIHGSGKLDVFDIILKTQDQLKNRITM